MPATSANLGCAFDCGGLALKLYLKTSYTPSRSSDSLTLEYHGRAPDRIPLDDSNLVLSSFRYACAHLGRAVPEGHIQVESDIPVGVGLGSSAAAVIAGLVLGVRCCGADVPAGELLRWAEEIEGHVDNAAAAYHGGLVLALCNNIDQVVTLKTTFPDHIKLVVVTPSVTVPTHEARRVLPKAYERADVLHTLQRTALLAATCFSGKFELFPELFDDRLHQPYRQQLAPGIAESLRFRHEGLLGIAISGSGSSVIAMTVANESQIAECLQKIFALKEVQTEALITSADNRGSVVTCIGKAANAIGETNAVGEKR
ncbi:MAG TPA: homoserine kinase [Candidatus Dormibacteraeota bacterium]|nr:homoserine kinase [Candidatus Dormibacteraeota bacterium]